LALPAYIAYRQAQFHGPHVGGSPFLELGILGSLDRKQKFNYYVCCARQFRFHCNFLPKRGYL